MYALDYHTVADAFDTHDELAARVGALSAEGYLRGRTLTDVTGDPLTEYETPRGVDPASRRRDDEPPSEDEPRAVASVLA